MGKLGEKSARGTGFGVRDVGESQKNGNDQGELALPQEWGVPLIIV